MIAGCDAHSRPHIHTQTHVPVKSRKRSHSDCHMLPEAPQNTRNWCAGRSNSSTVSDMIASVCMCVPVSGKVCLCALGPHARARSHRSIDSHVLIWPDRARLANKEMRVVRPDRYTPGTGAVCVRTERKASVCALRAMLARLGLIVRLFFGRQW